ncbi:hypothetical protein C7B69_08315 [filamentous cyanobacterium Phorm 46]|nr:hypothetical protein C7B69_08315 [filamentous cyanobacterium Phorm 46]
MKAKIPQRTDTPLQLHGASQVDIRCLIFYRFASRTKTPALPIKFSGAGCVGSAKFRDRLTRANRFNWFFASYFYEI